MSPRMLPRDFFFAGIAGVSGCRLAGERGAESSTVTGSDLGSAAIANRSREASLVAAAFEHRQEGLLRNFDLAELLHPLLAFALLLQQLALAGDVAAIALGGDVLAQRGDGFPGDDPRADGGLKRNLELMLGDFAFEPFHEGAAPLVGFRAMHDRREGIDPIALHQNVE